VSWGFDSLSIRQSKKERWMVQRYIKDNKVAVIYSPGYGSGWYSWNYDSDMLFDRQLVQCILEKDEKSFLNIINEKYSDVLTEFENLEIEWVELGKSFHIHEYDGNESVMFKEDYEWIKA